MTQDFEITNTRVVIQNHSALTLPGGLQFNVSMPCGGDNKYPLFEVTTPGGVTICYAIGGTFIVWQDRNILGPVREKDLFDALICEYVAWTVADVSAPRRQDEGFNKAR